MAGSASQEKYILELLRGLAAAHYCIKKKKKVMIGLEEMVKFIAYFETYCMFGNLSVIVASSQRNVYWHIPCFRYHLVGK